VTICNTVRDVSGTPTKALATRSQVSIKLADRLQHRLRPIAAPKSKLDEATWALRARPEGVMRCEVWLTLIDSG